MKNNKEQQWQAYIDGELSATEMASFETTLSALEQEQLRSDMQFDRGISDRLAENASCPMEIWERTKALLMEATSDDSKETIVQLKPNSQNRPMLFGAATLLVAAMLALVISTFTPNPVTSPVILEAATIDELVSKSEVSDDIKLIEQFMHENNIALDLLPEDSLSMTEIHAPLFLIGARKNKECESIELFAGCCKEPVKIILVHRDSEAAKLIGQAIGAENDLQATRIVGNYLAAVVGKHSAHDILDIFADQHP